MSCRLCDGSGKILKNGRYLECQPCKLRRSDVPKILGMSDLSQKTNNAVENACFAVENSPNNYISDLKMRIIERLLFLHNEGGLSWRDIAVKAGKDHTSVMRWSKGQDLANNPRILINHVEKLKEVCVNGS